MTLRPCITCSRHVAVVDRVCPFCGTELVAKSPTSLVVAPGRLSRAAVFAGATLAGTACWSSSPAQTTTPAGSARTTKQDQTGIAAGTITGVITSTDTVQPVPGVTVRVIGPTEQEVYTDATGTYVFTKLAPGDYELQWTLQPNHPRRQPARKPIKVDATGGQRIDLTVHIPPPMPDNMPYGAPPRRKRVV